MQGNHRLYPAYATHPRMESAAWNRRGSVNPASSSSATSRSGDSDGNLLAIASARAARSSSAPPRAMANAAQRCSQALFSLGSSGTL